MFKSEMLVTEIFKNDFFVWKKLEYIHVLTFFLVGGET